MGNCSRTQNREEKKGNICLKRTISKNERVNIYILLTECEVCTGKISARQVLAIRTELLQLTLCK